MFMNINHWCACKPAYMEYEPWIQKDKMHHDLCSMNSVLPQNRLSFESWPHRSASLWTGQVTEPLPSKFWFSDLWASLVVRTVKNLPAMWEARCGFDPCIRKTTWRRKFQYSSLENSMDRGDLRATVNGSQRVRYNWVTNTFTFFSV